MTTHESITIKALDSREDWFGDYVEAVEEASGLEYTHDDSQYGIFRDDSGTLHAAHVAEDRSDGDEWTVMFFAPESD